MAGLREGASGSCIAVCLIRINSVPVRESYDNGSSVRGNLYGMFSVVVLSWDGLRFLSNVMRTTRFSAPCPWLRSEAWTTKLCCFRAWLLERMSETQHSRFG